MPRKLPWLAEAARKKATSAPAAPRRKRTASPSDLVNSDLDDLDDAPKPKKKKQAAREPSSSPPPLARGPPPTVYMNEGLTGDDAFMMVEDEFYSTAQLFTRHLHYEEYELLKRKHKSRGRETLANLQRGTDNGRTQQSKQLRLRLEAEETRKKQAELRRLAGESSDEDEYMEDPQLAGLMTGSQMNSSRNLTKLAQARSNGSLQSPSIPSRTRDALAAESSTRLRTAPTFAPIEEADEDEDTDDSDDLDVKPTKMQRAYNQWADHPASETTFPSIEKSGTVVADSAPRATMNRNHTFRHASPEFKPTMLSKPKSPARTLRSPIRVKVEEELSPIRPIKRVRKKFRSFFDDEPPEPSQIVPVKAEKSDHVKKKEAEKRKEIEDSIPTFLF